jgi:hypothetical protein
MKLLIATRGNRLDSMLAKNAQLAEWYLVVDSATLEVTPVRGLGQPLGELLAAASTHGVTTLLTGSSERHSRMTLNAGWLSVSFAGDLTAREALDRWEHGGLRYYSADRAPSSGKSKHRPEQAWLPRSTGKRTISRNSFLKHLTTPVRHHLQQYAGRGH